jgi:hypothetical protein
MPRPVPEWIGKHDGVNIPTRVRQRIYDRDKCVCHLCKLPIKSGETWQADHVVALINGGAHRESNIAPAHSICHVVKSAKDMAVKAKTAKVRAKYSGAMLPAARPIQSRGFPARKSRAPKAALAPKQLYAKQEQAT